MAGYKDALANSRKSMGEFEGAPLKEKKTVFAQTLGLDEKEVNDKNMSGIHDAAQGAQKVAESGGDPQKLSYEQLRGMQDQKSLEKEKPADIGKQKMIFQSIIGILPTVLGYAIGGEKGGAIGGNVGIQGMKDVEKFYDDENTRSANAAKLANDESWKQKEYDLKNKQFDRDLSKDEESSKLNKAKIEYYGKKGAAGGANSMQQQRFERTNQQNIYSGEDKLRDDFSKNDVVKQYQEAARGMNKLRELTKKPERSSADDIALIYAFMKAQDPGSVVREGEYATAQKYAGTMFDNYGIKLNRAGGLEGILTEKQRSNLLNAAESIFPAYEQPYKQLAESIRGVAQKRGYDPNAVLTSFDGIQQQTQQNVSSPAQMTREQKIQMLKQMGHK